MKWIRTAIAMAIAGLLVCLWLLVQVTWYNFFAFMLLAQPLIVLALLIFRRRWRAVGIAVLCAVLVVGGSEAIARATYRPAALLHPRFSGSLSLAPKLIGPAETALGRLEDFQGQLERIVGGAARLYGSIEASGLGDGEDIRVLGEHARRGRIAGDQPDALDAFPLPALHRACLAGGVERALARVGAWRGRGDDDRPVPFLLREPERRAVAARAGDPGHRRSGQELAVVAERRTREQVIERVRQEHRRRNGHRDQQQ